MIIGGRTYSVGADPEVFASKNGVFVSAHDLIEGDKLKPQIVEKGAVQVDGLALEFNIDPADSFEEFSGNISTVTDILKGMIGDHEFLDAVSVNFDKKFMEGIPNKNLELGCGVDFNAWLMSPNESPDPTKLMRTAGGHIHIGGMHTNDPFSKEHFTKCSSLIKCLDYTLGLPSLLWDSDDERRSMYGQAGAFRPKNYGVEYRTLSNKWIFKPDLIKYVYSGVEAGLKLFHEGFTPDPDVQHVINESDRSSPLLKGFKNVFG